MKTRNEGHVSITGGSLHLMRVDGRLEVHRIPAGNDLKDHSPRLCVCGARTSVRNLPAVGLVTAHDHALLGAVPAAFGQ